MAGRVIPGGLPAAPSTSDGEEEGEEEQISMEAFINLQNTVYDMEKDKEEMETKAKKDAEEFNNKNINMNIQVQELLNKISEMRIEVNKINDMEKEMKALTIGKMSNKKEGMEDLKPFNTKDMVKPGQYDMEPGTFQNWNELFTGYLMSIDPRWELILHTIQRQDSTMTKRRGIQNAK